MPAPYFNSFFYGVGSHAIFISLLLVGTHTLF